ncbi:MAG: LPS export ABC transporter permease LptG [Paracoccus sp. (in: a-proteobacteria)]
MRVLFTYFSRILVVRILAVLLSFVALLVMMDLIDSMEEVLARRGSTADVFVFVGYRLPTIAERLIPLSVLIGTTLGMLALAMHSELVALRAAGLSQLRIAALGIPVCLMIVLGHFLLADRVAPRSEQAFVEWWEPLARLGGTHWLKGETNVVRIGAISKDARRLDDVTLFQRDATGRLTAQVSAGSASFGESGWQLQDVSELSLGASGPARQDSALQPWPDGPRPEVILDLVSGPEQLSTGALGKILAVSWSSTAEPSVYRTELARRAVAPLTSLVMMLIAVSAIRGQGRSGGPQRGAALALALGLTFMVLDGIFASLGRAGVLAPAIAAWTPLLIFAAIAGVLLLRLKG